MASYCSKQKWKLEHPFHIMTRSNDRVLLPAMVKKRTVVNEKLFSIECFAISINDKLQIQFDQGIKRSSFICQFQKVLPC